MIEVIDTSHLKKREYPEQLNGAWFYYVFFKNHPNPSIGGICCVYFNNRYPSGSVCTGEYILNDYPDAYSVWGPGDENGNVPSGRVFVSPILRGIGVAIATGAYGMRMLKDVFGKTIYHLGGSEFGNRAYVSAAKIGDLPEMENLEVAEGFHMNKEYFDQPIYPYMFFGKRVST